MRSGSRAAAARGFGVGSPIFLSVLRSVWWNGSGAPGMTITVSCSYDHVPSGWIVTSIVTRSVLNACSRNGLETIPLVSEPRTASRLNVFASGRGVTDRHRDLRARNGQRVEDRAGRRLPEPVAHLIVERLHGVGLDDVRVVAEPVEELRAVRLRIDRLELVPLDEGLLLRASGRGMDVFADGALPDAGHAGQRTEVLQRVDVGVGLRVDVSGKIDHGCDEPRER